MMKNMQQMNDNTDTSNPPHNSSPNETSSIWRWPRSWKLHSRGRRASLIVGAVLVFLLLIFSLLAVRYIQVGNLDLRSQAAIAKVDLQLHGPSTLASDEIAIVRLQADSTTQPLAVIKINLTSSSPQHLTFVDVKPATSDWRVLEKRVDAQKITLSLVTACDENGCLHQTGDVPIAEVEIKGQAQGNAELRLHGSEIATMGQLTNQAGELSPLQVTITGAGQ